jgi:hypothetical protein
MPGKKKCQKGAHLKAGSGKRPERKYDADTDEDPRDDEFQPEDRAGESSGASGAEDDDDMAVEMARELQALAGGRRTRAVKQQKVVHAPRAAVAANAASSSTPRALISSYFVARTPVLAATPPPPAAASSVTPATAPVPAPCTIPPDGGCVAHTTDPPEAPAPCLICLEVINPQATGNSACLTLPCQHHFHGEISWRYAAEYRKGESGNAVVRAVAQQCSKRHRDTSDPRARQAEAAMEA